MWLLLWHRRWRYEAPIWSTACMVWATRAWQPDSLWIRCRSDEAGRGAIHRYGRILTPVFNAGLLVLFPVRSLDSLLIWAPVRAPDELLFHLFAEAFVHIVLPLWLQFCGLIHMFSAYCGACFPPRLDPSPRLVGADCLVRGPARYAGRALFVGEACLVRGPSSVVRGYAM
ncbi:hypothetical protein V6N13_016177 [Hibiscus sabdariffa]